VPHHRHDLANSYEQLAAELANRGRDGEAELALHRVKGLRRKSELGKVEVYLDVLRGRADQALKKAQALVDEETKDPRQLVWVARVLAAGGQYRKAEEKLDRALAAAAVLGAVAAGSFGALVMRALDRVLPRPMSALVTTAIFGTGAGVLAAAGTAEFRRAFATASQEALVSVREDVAAATSGAGDEPPASSTSTDSQI
jgi:hypothetical protein